MPILTLQQTITMAKNQCGETLSTPGANDPFEWQNLVLQAADLEAEDTNCYQTNYTFDYVANQSTYSSPQGLYQIVSVKYYDSSLMPQILVTMLDAEMDDRMPTWQNSPNQSGGTPQFLVTRGLNSLVLWPTPNTSSLVFNYTDLVIAAGSQYQVSSAGQRVLTSGDAGYVILITGGTGFNTGRYVIQSVSGGVATVDQPMGTVNSTGGVGEITNGGVNLQGFGYPSYAWTSLSQTNPLPIAGHMSTMWRAALMRTAQFPKEQQARLSRLEYEWRQAHNALERSATKWTPATRRGVRRKFPFGGGFY